jgi:7-carboxy-7-deazaguanine synthase (Cx14CxxC type)
MSYTVKEIFYTLQGEGAQAGRPAVLCRFTGCNLWNGHESARAHATCSFCDTDFVGTDGPGGGRFATPTTLADAIASAWTGAPHERFVVFTGGEPTLQLDELLLVEVHERGFTTAIETNGTLPVPVGVDWICVSPKAGAPLRQRSGHELKLVFPQQGLQPFDLDDIGDLDFAHRFLQPCDGPDLAEHTRAAIVYCLAHPRWRLSLQSHKLIGIR